MAEHEQGSNRRAVILALGAAVTLPSLVGGLAPAMAQDAPNGWEEAIAKVVGSAKPVEGKLSFDLPEIAENGNTVPFAIAVDSPMSESEHAKAVHIFSTGNPQALIATFAFTPESGKAAVAGRMRLARTQDIIAIAELSDGRFLMNRRGVKVTIGGCGG